MLIRLINSSYCRLIYQMRIKVLFNVQAIANLSVNAKVAKAVADEGGISILADLARSMNRLVAEEAAGGLWNLSVGEEHKVFILSVLLQ